MLGHIFSLLSTLELMVHPVLSDGSFLVPTGFAVVLLTIRWLGILDHWSTIIHINDWITNNGEVLSSFRTS